MRVGSSTIDVEDALADLGLPPRQWGSGYVKVECPFGDHENDSTKPGLGVLVEPGKGPRSRTDWAGYLEL